MTAAIDFDAIAAALSEMLADETPGVEAPSRPEPAPSAAKPAEEKRHSFPMERLEAAPSVRDAVVAALEKVYPGESKTAKARREKLLTAIDEEIGELYVYGIDFGGRIPIGDPIVLDNALIEVDGYGDVTRITCNGGWPIWDPS